MAIAHLVQGYLHAHLLKDALEFGQPLGFEVHDPVTPVCDVHHLEDYQNEAKEYQKYSVTRDLVTYLGLFLLHHRDCGIIPDSWDLLKIDALIE